MEREPQGRMNRLPARLAAYGLAGVLWAVLSQWVAWHVVWPGFPDGFQSVGAAVGASPGHLAWPFVGNFEEFGRTWGYHWFGWPMLRSWLGILVPWTSAGDALLLHGMRWLAAAWVAEVLLRQTRSLPAAWVGFLTVLLFRGWFCSMAFLARPETPASLLLWMAALPLLDGRWRGPIRGGVAVLALVAAPSMHPLAVPAAFLIGAAGVFESWRCGRISGGLCRWGLPVACGFALLGSYYLTDPRRLAQLEETIATMRAVRTGIGATMMRLFADPKNIFFSLPMTAVAGGLSLWLFQGRSAGVRNISTGWLLVFLLIVVAPAYLIAAGHPNTGHAAALAPFTGFAAGHLQAAAWKSGCWRRMVRFAVTGQAAACAVPLLLAGSALATQVRESPRAVAKQTLSEALASGPGTIFIPLSLWEAAAEAPASDRARIRFASFPNYAFRGRRDAYEREVIASLGTGDVLVTETAETRGSDPLDVLPGPRAGILEGTGPWREVSSHTAVGNFTMAVGRFRKRETVLGALRVFRYDPATTER